MIKYGLEELKQINFFFPNLYYNKNYIRGELDFSSKFQKRKGKKGYWQVVPCSQDQECIEDVYEIEIQLDHQPIKVFETNGRIKKLANELNKNIEELHLQPSDESCCLGIFWSNNNETLSSFVINKVYPFFVWQAYFEKFRCLPPCGEYSHGKLGESEFMSNIATKRKHHPCPCGSGKSYRKCCLTKK